MYIIIATTHSHDVITVVLKIVTKSLGYVKNIQELPVEGALYAWFTKLGGGPTVITLPN